MNAPYSVSSGVQWAAKAVVLLVATILALLHDLTPELAAVLVSSLAALGITNGATIVAQGKGVSDALGPRVERILPPGPPPAPPAVPTAIAPPSAPPTPQAVAAALVGKVLSSVKPPPAAIGAVAIAVLAFVALPFAALAGLGCTPAERSEARVETAETVRALCAYEALHAGDAGEQ